jgi:hypothetical protein
MYSMKIKVEIHYILGSAEVVKNVNSETSKNYQIFVFFVCGTKDKIYRVKILHIGRVDHSQHLEFSSHVHAGGAPDDAVRPPPQAVRLPERPTVERRLGRPECPSLRRPGRPAGVPHEAKRRLASARR